MLCFQDVVLVTDPKSLEARVTVWCNFCFEVLSVLPLKLAQKIKP